MNGRASPWETVWWLLKKVNAEPQHAPADPLLGSCPEVTGGAPTGISTPRLTAALSTVARRQPKTHRQLKNKHEINTEGSMIRSTGKMQASGLTEFIPFICTSAAAAAAAKSLQSCPTLCDPRDGSPLGFSVPGILQARTLEWVAISFSNA